MAKKKRRVGRPSNAELQRRAEREQAELQREQVAVRTPRSLRLEAAKRHLAANPATLTCVPIETAVDLEEGLILPTALSNKPMWEQWADGKPWLIPDISLFGYRAMPSFYNAAQNKARAMGKKVKVVTKPFDMREMMGDQVGTSFENGAVIFFYEEDAEIAALKSK